MTKSIDDLILSEVEYFRPMLERAKRSSEVEQTLWRNETIRQRQERISLEVHELCEGTVRYGPFRGLKLDRNTHWGKLDLGSQCLGLYEKEFLDFIAKIENNRFSTFIDIGAADGYYAVGMLISKKVEKVVCFEESQNGRETIKRNWLDNRSPGYLRILGEANIESVATLVEEDLKKTLILIDIEGGEFSLLNDRVLGSFDECTLLVEVHNWVDDFTAKYSELLKRVDQHFNIDVIERVDRRTVDIPELRDFTDDNRLLLTSERRPCLMRYLYLTPKVGEPFVGDANFHGRVALS